MWASPRTKWCVGAEPSWGENHKVATDYLSAEIEGGTWIHLNPASLACSLLATQKTSSTINQQVLLVITAVATKKEEVASGFQVSQAASPGPQLETHGRACYW